MAKLINLNHIEQAVQHLLEGELVAFPTETVYGLGADARNDEAVRKIYKAKGRPEDHPIIVHIANGSDLTPWAKDIPDVAYQLMEAFFPGPLTLIFKCADDFFGLTCGGQRTIGIRCPEHPVAQKLLMEFMQKSPNGVGGVSAPSANLFGHVSPTSSEHVMSDFKDQDIWVLEGGRSSVGIESTILDLSRFDEMGMVLLRPGDIRAEDIEQVTGLAVRDKADLNAPQVSGSLKAHYATRTPMCWVDNRQQLERMLTTTESLVMMAYDVRNLLAGCDFLDWAFEHDYQPIVCDVSEEILSIYEHSDSETTSENRPFVYLIPMSSDMYEYAHELYEMMHQADSLACQQIVVQSLPSNKAWDAIYDRLSRAVAHYTD